MSPEVALALVAVFASVAVGVGALTTLIFVSAPRNNGPLGGFPAELRTGSSPKSSSPTWRARG